MLPRDLQADQFAAYPPEARKLIVAHLPALRELPLSFVPSLLREVIDYDFKFPVERSAIERELANLSSLSLSQLGAVCRVAGGIPLDHSSAGCISKSGFRLWRSAAGGSSRRSNSSATVGRCDYRSRRNVL